MNRNALDTAMKKPAPAHHPTLACWGLGDAVCLIYLLFLLGRLRFLHFQLMLDCTVSNKWNEFSDLILVLRLLSTSLSDCTAWHRPGWVSSLWSWEARPGIAGVGGVVLGQEQNEAERQFRWQGSALQFTEILQVKMKEPHQLWGEDWRTARKGAAREKLRTAAYQTQPEQIRVPQTEKEGISRALEEKRCSWRSL